MTDGMEFETYLRDRVSQYRGWYDKKAVTAKSRYLSMRAFTVIAGGLVPVLINLSIDTTVFGYSVKTGVVTLISLLVVIAVSLENVFHYREQWKNYRSTEQLLSHEEFRFRARIGAYQELDENTAFRTFVERCEDAISSENTATLNVMTLASEAADDKQRKHGAV